MLLSIGVLHSARLTQRPPQVVMLGNKRVMSAAAAWCKNKVKATGLILCKRAARPTALLHDCVVRSHTRMRVFA